MSKINILYITLLTTNFCLMFSADRDNDLNSLATQAGTTVLPYQDDSVLGKEARAKHQRQLETQRQMEENLRLERQRQKEKQKLQQEEQEGRDAVERLRSSERTNQREQEQKSRREIANTEELKRKLEEIQRILNDSVHIKQSNSSPIDQKKAKDPQCSRCLRKNPAMETLCCHKFLCEQDTKNLFVMAYENNQYNPTQFAQYPKCPYCNAHPLKLEIDSSKIA